MSVKSLDPSLLDARQDVQERPCDRWVHVCAWDGHELGPMAYEQVSDHERICLFHRRQFDSWLDEVRAKADRAGQSRPGRVALTHR